MSAVEPELPIGAPPDHQFRHSVRNVAASPRRWGRIFLVLVAIALAIALVAILGKWFGSKLPRFEHWIQSLGWWGPAVFLAAFSVLTLFQVPEFLLAIAGGVAFGLWEGFLVVIAANVTAALFAFFLYRLVFRKRFEQMLQRHPKTHAVESAVSAKGFKLMLLLRLAPFNFSLLNAIFGASNVRLTPFLFALVGIIPGNFSTVYFGTVARHVAQKSAGVDTLGTTHEISLFVGFLVTVVICLFVAHVAHHALEQVESSV